MKKMKRCLAAVLAGLLAVSLLPGSALAEEDTPAAHEVTAAEVETPSSISTDNLRQPTVEQNVYNDDTMVTAIVEFDAPAVMDYFGTSTYAVQDGDTSAGEAVSDFLASADAKQTAQQLLDDQQGVIDQITALAGNSGIATMDLYDDEAGDDGIVARWSILVNGMAIQVPYGVLDDIRGLDGVKRAYVQHVYDPPTEELLKSSEDALYSYSYDKVDVQEAWQAGYTGEGMLVAVLDTGLDITWGAMYDEAGEQVMGVTRSHEAFRDNSFLHDPDDEENGWTLRYDYDSMKDFLAENQLNSTTNGDGEQFEWDYNALYKNKKVPYACDYADGDVNVQPASNEHGTHVSGTIAGFAKSGEGEILFSGVAPDAQLMMMKVFSDQDGGAMEATIVNALEDALKLGADVINLSLGSDNGFSEDDTMQNEIYARAEAAGIALMTSAGNSGYSSVNNNYGGNPLASDVDTSMMSSPAIYSSNLSVASLENSVQVQTYMTWDDADGETHNVTYTDPWTVAMKATFGGKSYPVYLVGGTGTWNDYNAVGWYNEYSNPNGKTGFALVARGDISFAEKVQNGQQFHSVDYRTGESRGVLGVIVYDNDPNGTELINMSVENTTLSSAFINGQNGAAIVEALNAGYQVELTVQQEDLTLESPTDGQMSSFSSWGAGPSLELKPEITAPGGNIWSSIIDTVNTGTDGYTGSYGMMSGTSMAAPHMSGIAALVRQRVLQEDAFSDLEKGQMDNIINQLLVSTAIPQKDLDGVYYSPRQQGAGLVNANNALTTPVYISVEGQNVGKLELKDDPDHIGSYPIAFTLHNISDQEVTYDVSVTLMRPKTANVDSTWGERTTALHQDEVIKTVSLDQVTVAANGTAEFQQTVTLTDDEKATLDSLFENGVYVEGFVTLTDTAEVAPGLGLPLLAYYGDWTAAPIFDAASWVDDAQDDTNVFNNESTWGVNLLGSAAINPSTGEILGYLNLGQNPFDPASATDQNVYQPENITISPNGDQYLDRVDDYILYQLRDAKAIVVRVTDADTGEVYFQEWSSYIPRTVYNATYGVAVPITAQYYGVIPIWEGTDQEGNVLPDGTKCNYEIIAYGDGDYGETVYEESTGLNVTDFDSLAAGTLTPTFNGHALNMTGDVISFPVTVDTNAPALENHTVSIYEEDGHVYMTGTVHEDESSLAYVQILPYVTRTYTEGYGDPNYAEVGLDYNNPFYADYFYEPATKSYTFTADITSYNHTSESYPGENNTYNFEWTGNVMVACGDYGANERTYNISVDTSNGLVLSQTSALLHPGSSFDLSVIDNTGTEGEIERSSSNPEVATVDEMGKVTAIAPGQAIITVSKGSASATCVVAVEDYNTTVEDFDLVPVNFDGLKQDGQLLVKVDNLQPADVQLNEIRWEVFEDEAYAEDYGAGLLSVEQNSSDGLSGSIYITGSDSEVTLPAGTGYLNVTLNGVTKTMQFSWDDVLPTSSTEDDLIPGTDMGDQVLYVDQGGSVDLLAMYRQRSQHEVSDVVAELDGLQLDGPDFFYVGGSYEAKLVPEEGYTYPAAEDLHLYTRYSDGSEVEIVNYEWDKPYSYDASTGELKVQRAPSGADNVLVIRAVGTASDGAPAGEMSGQTWERPDGLYGPFDWTVTSGEGTLEDTTVEISGQQVATKRYTPSEPGVSTITAASKDGRYSVNFAVVCQGILADTIDLPQEQHSLSLDRGTTYQLTPILTPEPTLDEDKAVVYTSFNPEIATVDENGMITALNKGQAYIKIASAVDNKVVTYCVVSVSEQPYSVQFVDYDGRVIKQVWVANGKSAEPPADPVREGYTFTGWDGNYTNVTGDQIITAQYSINHYTVTFMADGQVVGTLDAAYGQYLTSADYPAVPAKAGYTGAWRMVTDPITGDITLEAVYTPIATGGGNASTTGNDTIAGNTSASASAPGGSANAAQGGSNVIIPETADAMPYTVVIALLVISGACLACLVVRRRKKQ